MAVIRCRGKLWRRLDGKRPSGSEAAFPGILLGSWAAKRFACQSRELIIAVNERTYLTVVLPLVPRERFSAEFAAAVGTALRDLRIPEPIARAESAAVELMPIARFGSSDFAAVLARIQYFCERELCYHADLRIVQRNLNHLPHPNRDPCVPLEAVRQLFDNRSERSLT